MTAPHPANRPLSLLLVGSSGGEHVGYHLRAAAGELELPTTFCDVNQAYRGTWLWRKISWHLRGRRPARLAAFSREVIDLCQRHTPDVLLSTGFAPIDVAALRDIEKRGVRTVNFLTDDPWNPALHAPWFLEALPCYSAVFSPRRANLDSLRALGCREVRYLPFAFAPQIHHPERVPSGEETALASDVIFAGGGDADRVPYIAALRQAGIDVALYGGYWDRFPETRNLSRGMASPELLRKAIRCARIALCLVRRANRDGHCMRTFEVPAVGACMIAEDTEEHRALFGGDGQAVLYFHDPAEMLEKVRRLLSSSEERERLANAAHQLIVQGGHTYQHRLRTMLGAL